ncbi:NAD(P)/FAD-dependent oxidoreductase [Modicisalibacter tunisiensis]|uniref:Tryptophan 7-halogenase n=1 Tax=Modicisalibacter tunisiensis TaxID=390637 RepID=A0ABS7X2R6_9GAMM|nr:NAD(P)/FAD-dependent oxidoreductase [Modicisalibacter tunisiensis]MBZ9569185.1 tryptophan 7-halogenase [Modicisalibacter tunisiensis]
MANLAPRADASDVVVIGAGPAGALAAARLADSGHRVQVVERTRFPRFSIGESLLPQCMAPLERAGLLDAVLAGDYQPKNGAAFTRRGVSTVIDFHDKTTPGWATTFQVERADFDQRLIEAARARGARVDFATTVDAVEPDARHPRLTVRDDTGHTRRLETRFILDASGYGRVLARRLGLARDPRLESRTALFTHVDTGLDDDFDREKILIGVHPDDAQLWYWLIPFRDGRASVGVVGDTATLEAAGDDAESRWRTLVDAEPRFAELLAGARPIRPVDALAGYSADVERLHGPGFALLGNAGEFLDPVFSSGVTIALRSADMAVPLVERTLAGESPDWAGEFERPLRAGTATFRAFVEAWYDGRLQRIIFHPDPPAELRRRISAVLAGYAWDRDNPLVTASRRRLDLLAELCGPLPEARP